jgi:signal transduction histidine kinase
MEDYVFDVAVPVTNEDGDVPIGVVGLTIRRKVLTDTILPIRVGETGHGMLLDTAGTPLICPVLPPTAHLIQDSLVNQLARDEPLWLVADDDAHGGHNSIIGAAPVRFAHQLSPASLGGYRWFAFVRQEPGETFAPIYSLLVTVGMIGFGLVVVLSSLGFLVGRQIVGPIRALQREAETLRRNVSALPAPVPPVNFESPSAPPEVRTGDEVEELARTFYAMRTALEDSIRTVKAQHEELIRREKLASVGQLLAALAHDLRNPLGVIRSSAQLVLESSQSPDVKHEVARYIIDEVDRLAHRINDFLRYARQKPPEPKSIPPEQLVQAALAQWRAQGRHEQIKVETKFRHGRTEAHIDPDQVKEALVNLLVNAREAMPDGGQLTVATRLVDGSLELEVADTGPGIPPAHLERIFEPFFTTKEYGTGLGLTNVKRLVEDNRGSLAVHSVEGKGTSFRIRLPTGGPANVKANPAKG